MKQKTRRTIENRRRAKVFVEACAGALPVPVVTVTCGGNVLSVNPTARDLFGIPLDDAITPELTDLLVMDDGSDSAITTACRTLNPVSGIVKIQTTSGTRDVNCTSVPFMGDEENVLLVTLLFSEPTENDGRFMEGYAGHLMIRPTSTDLQEIMNEWEEILLAFSRGDLRMVPQAGIQDPLARLKFLYNEGIAAVQKMVSVKDLFG
jgi:hypothetical protein